MISYIWNTLLGNPSNVAAMIMSLMSLFLFYYCILYNFIFTSSKQKARSETTLSYSGLRT